MFTLFQCLFITELSPYLSRRKVCSAGLPPPLPMNIIVAIQAAYQKKETSNCDNFSWKVVTLINSLTSLHFFLNKSFCVDCLHRFSN